MAMEIPNVGGSFNLKNENLDFIIKKQGPIVRLSEICDG